MTKETHKKTKVRGGLSLPRFVFVLVPEYSALSLVSALETLRAANQEQENVGISWRVLTLDGENVMSSLGTCVQVDGPLGSIASDEIVLVCGGVDVWKYCSRALLDWLRLQYRLGRDIGGLCTAAHVLARAGLVSGKKTSIHWENRDAFCEEFPEVELTERPFVLDGRLHSTAGGTASIDLILSLLARWGGQQLSNRVAARLNYNEISALQQAARVGSADFIGIQNPRLRPVLDLMMANLEEPVSNTKLTKCSGVSVRQLERLFQRYLGTSPKRFYTRLRLDRGHRLLLQSNLSITEISVACGFISSGHFAKVFVTRFGESPSQLRRRLGGFSDNYPSS